MGLSLKQKQLEVSILVKPPPVLVRMIGQSTESGVVVIRSVGEPSRAQSISLITRLLRQDDISSVNGANLQLHGTRLQVLPSWCKIKLSKYSQPQDSFLEFIPGFLA